MLVVFPSGRIDQMHRSDVAIATAYNRHAAKAADREAARRKAAAAEFTEKHIERNVMAAHNHKIERLRAAADQAHTRVGVGIQRS